MKKIINSTICLILLLEVRFFYLIELPEFINKFNTYRNKQIICLLCILLFIIMIITNNMNKIKSYFFSNNILILLLIFILQFLYTYLKYDQQFKSLIVASYYFFIITLYYILITSFERYDSYNFFIKLLTVISLFVSLIFILQAIQYNNSGKLFLHIYELNYGEKLSFRNSNLRLTYPSTIVSFSTILSSINLFDGKKDYSKKLDVINIFFGVVYLVYVCQTRTLTLIVLVCVLITIFLKFNNKTYIKIIYNIFIFITIGLILRSNKVQEFFKSFASTSSENIGSIYARSEAISYYLSILKENPINGMGFLLGEFGDKFYNVVHGYQGYLNTTDVGIVGLVVILGPLGVIWYFNLLYKIAKTTITVNSNKNIKKYISSIVFLIFLILTSATLIITDPQRIIVLPIIMSIVEYNLKKERYS